MFWKQLYLLLWKNFILRKRHPIRTLIEVLWPLFLLVVLVAIRKTQDVETMGECHYPARALPSAGVYPWLKSILCDVQNPCFSVPVSSETPGQINNPMTSINGSTDALTTIFNLLSMNTTILNNFGQLTTDLQLLANVSVSSVSNTPLSLDSLLQNATETRQILSNDLGLPENVTETILNSNVSFAQALALPTVIGTRVLVCNTTSLNASIQISASSPSTVTDVSVALCNLTNDELGLLSNVTATGLGNTTDLAGKFARQGVVIVDPTAFNNSNLFAAQMRLNRTLLELQTIQGPALGALNALTQGLTSSSILSMFGANGNMSNAAQEICGHPENKTTVLSTLLEALTANSSTSSGNTFSAASSMNTGNTTSGGTFCDNIASQMQGNIAFKVIWDTVKVFLYGKITYSPDTPLVRKIIKEANATFEAIAFVELLDKTWKSTTGPALYQQLENGTTTTTLRDLLNNPATVGFITAQTNLTAAQIEQLKVFLSNDDNPNDTITTWKDVYRQVDGLLSLVSQVVGCFELDKFVGYSTEEELVKNSLALLDKNMLFGGVVFISPSSLDDKMPPVIKYKIRQDATTATRTTRTQRFSAGPGSENSINQVKYFVSGFVHLQDLIETAILNYAKGNSTYSPMGSYLQFMPYPCYTRDRFLEFLANLMALIMTLAWIYSVSITVKNIVYEKEQRLKEVMKMMGLSNGVHWVAWFINSFLLMLISILFMVVILKAGDIMPFSNMFIVFLWLCCFILSIIAQCFLISCFFSRANLAAACGGVIFFLLYIPYTMADAWKDQLGFSSKLAFCLLSNVAFGYGTGFISQYEQSGEGIQFSNWATNPDPSERLTFATTLIMMLFDSFLYFLLTWYIENVFPGTYGVPRPWYFFATRSYWCGGGSSRSKENNGITPPADMSNFSANLESEPRDLALGVAIHNIKKVYGNGKVAVDDLSINFYEDQITSFLGHNGAGKTTTMSMLTGLFTPTTGTAYVYGNDICTDMDSIRSQLGFCPQYNVLFGDLTVYEHLKLYSGLKNSQGGEAEIEQMLKDVGLPHKRNEVSRHLSGGMKRKLSVAVAFVGGSKCVILDEPTAGVDPYARRGIWDLLLAYREKRTIILSTHHMDEADLLGDRIAIISHGKLKCCGSSIFLKSNYGVGYYLTVVKNGGSDTSSNQLTPVGDEAKTSLLSLKTNDEGFESQSDEKSKSATPISGSSSSSSFGSHVGQKSDGANGNNLLTIPSGEVDYSQLVLDTIPNAKLHEEDGREVTFVLPYAAQNEGWYAKLFGKLDARGISYGLTDTSLEEIFLTVAEGSRDEGRDEKKKCCSCLPRRKRRSVTPETELSTEHQARRGSSRRKRRQRSASETSQTGIIETQSVETATFDDGSQGRGSYKVTGKKLVLQQFAALFVKRFHHARRNRKGFVAQVIVPAIFVALALAFAQIIPSNRNLPPLELQPWMYGDTNTFYSNDNPNGTESTSAADALISKPGIGMRCVANYSVQDFRGKYIECDNIADQVWTPDQSIRGHSQPSYSNETLTCKCTSPESQVLLAECPSGAGGSPTDRLVLETSNPIYNMTGRNVSDWMVKTVDRFRRSRYGGLSMGEKYHSPLTNQQFTFLRNLIMGNSLNNSFPEVTLESFVRTENTQVWFDNNGYHSMPTWLNVLNNAALRSLQPTGESRRDYGIAAINHPLNYSITQIDAAPTVGSARELITSICVIFALSFIPASFVLFLIEEKVTKAKHLQFVSGVNQFVYWISNFLWDLVNYTVPTIIVIIIFLCFQLNAYVSADNLPCLICLLLLYGYSITPMMYPTSFYFTVPSTAYVALTSINLFIGVNASIATFILELLDDPALNDANFYLKRVLLIFPQYCLGRGLIDMAVNQAYTDATAAFGIQQFRSPFEFDLVGRNLMSMAIVGTVFFILTVLIQYRFFIKTGKETGMKNVQKTDVVEDVDVKAERERISSAECDDMLLIKNLSKVYKNQASGKPLIAVDRMHVGVPQGECFGLLGVNGAGKTTTFKMLTGDTTPSSGDATICEQSILSNIRDVQQNTGYCPQFEALNSLLTGREHLEFYAKLRGVPPKDIPNVAKWGINKFGLKMYADKCAGTYSGGNKRKLSAAIAFIGCPPVVFLDEPTAGMDPMSRRFLWTRIAEAVRGGRCIVLTSHSMEECEALCSRLAIMVNGRFKCIGSPQHLKNRFGEGYTLTVKVDARCEEPENAQNFISSSFPTSVLKEHHSNMLLYQMPLNDVKLLQLFDVMERNKKEYHIEDYSVSQTTLDEVFVNFAKMQTGGLDYEPVAEINRSYEPIPGMDEGEGISLRKVTSNV